MDQTHTVYQNLQKETPPHLIEQIPLPIPDPDPPASPVSEIHGTHKPTPTVILNPEETSEVEIQPTSAGIARVLLQVFVGIMALSAFLVYTLTILTEGGMLLSHGIGHIAVGELFGGISRVTVQKVTPPLLSDSSLPPITSDSLTVPPLASLPANENASGSSIVTDIYKYDLSSDTQLGLGLINETPYTPVLDTLLTRTPIPSLQNLQNEYGTDAPIVLILHTHGTEAFSDSASTGYHTTDTTNNILSIGAFMAEILQENNIPTIHCNTLFDADSFESAYYNASLYIKEILSQYPSISYILDIHRDAITDGKNTGVAPYTEENGVGYAQMMFVVGTDHGGSGHIGWLDNLSLAVRLQAALYQKLPTLMRDINLRSASFNAQYAKGALLIETGAAASDMEDVKNSVRLLAEAIAKEIISPGKQTN